MPPPVHCTFLDLLLIGFLFLFFSTPPGCGCRGARLGQKEGIKESKELTEQRTMSQQVFSAHPALAVEQLQQAGEQDHQHRSGATSQSRRHPKTTPKKFTLIRSCAGGGAAGALSTSSSSPNSASKKSLPVRPNYASVDDDDDIECEDVDEVNFGHQDKVAREEGEEARQATKDCGIDETDHVQQRHKGHTATRHHHQDGGGGGGGGGGDQSDLSSVVSSPSVSTLSSPLSTPTRLPQPLHCCQKLQNGNGGGESRARSSPQQSQHPHRHHHHHQQQQHHHHHHHHHLTATGGGGGGLGLGSGGSGSGSCKAKKLDPRLNPSPYRQLLPIALCLLSFATVFATLIVYMDTTGESFVLRVLQDLLPVFTFLNSISPAYVSSGFLFAFIFCCWATGCRLCLPARIRFPKRLSCFVPSWQSWAHFRDYFTD